MRHIPNIIRILFLALFLFLLASGKVMLWLALFAASLIIALIFGRVYCGFACPMNTLMIPVEWVSKRLKLQTDKAPRWLKNGYFTFITLFVSVAVMLFSKRFLHIDLPILPFWLLMSVLITLRYKPEVFHNLICPFGALQKAFSRFTKMSEKVDTDSCIGCRLCERVCPSNAVLVSHEDKKAAVSTSLCHQCTKCQSVCPKSAIHYCRVK